MCLKCSFPELVFSKQFNQSCPYFWVSRLTLLLGTQRSSTIPCGQRVHLGHVQGAKLEVPDQRGGGTKRWRRGFLGTARPQVGTEPPCDHHGLLGVSWLSPEPLDHCSCVAVKTYGILSTLLVATGDKATSVEGMR